MKRLSRVLAAVDFSAPARAAFDRALALSRAHQARLTVVHAIRADQRFGADAPARLRLIAELRQMAEASGVPLAVRVQHGDPAGVVLLHADATHADLIVVGTGQRTGLARLRAGSVAERVLLKARQPVLIVPASSSGRAGAPLSRIAVAVDFDEATAAAVEHALGFAVGDMARVTLVHVVPGSAPADIPRDRYRFGVIEYQEILKEDARRRLQEIVPGQRTPSGQIHTRVVSGAPSDQIVQVAREVEADVIVVGVRERGLLSRTVFGATAARVVRLADRPILAVPAHLGQAGAHTKTLAA